MTSAQSQILATQLFGHLLYSLHTDGKLRQWNIRNGKLVSKQKVPKVTTDIDLASYKCKE
jgi:hypothetical protein